MESFIERSCSSRRCTPLMLGGVVIAFDAFKAREIHEFKKIISDVLKREETFEEVRTITLLGVLDKVLHPMGFKIQVGHNSFMGEHVRAIEEDVSRKIEGYLRLLQPSAEECEEKGVEIQVKITVGAPLANVIVEEISMLRATWAILDRQLKRETRCYLKQLPCKLAQIRDNSCLEILRTYHIENGLKNVKHKLVYALCKTVPLPPTPQDESDRNSLISLPITPMIWSNNLNSCSLSSPKSNSVEQLDSLNDESCTDPQEIQEISVRKKQENGGDGCSRVMVKDTCSENNEDEFDSSYSEMKMEPGEYSVDVSPAEDTDSKEEENKPQEQAEAPLSPSDKMNLDSLGCSYANVQKATDNFSFDNFIGEGGYGIVYKGKLSDGQLVAVKVQKETKAQTSEEFLSEVSPLKFARHKNIVALLGYCSKGNLRVLLYEYICNKSLEWHLFDNAAQVLEWNQRHSIAVGAAKGLHYLHEECRSTPIVHCNIRPSNVMLTREFVPMLGDFGLAKYSTSKFDQQRRILGNLGYVAPECKEGNIRCVEADVYAFGIVLMQLISGRKAVDNEEQSIRQWGLSLIKSLSLHELIDPRLEGSYCPYELYNMARAAYLCLQTAPLSRPKMKEVLYILEGTNDHLRHVKSNLYPMIISGDATFN